MPWLLHDDVSYVCVKDNEGNKQLLPLATVLYQEFRDHSIPTVTIKDHEITPKTKAFEENGMTVPTKQRQLW